MTLSVLFTSAGNFKIHDNSNRFKNCFSTLDILDTLIVFLKPALWKILVFSLLFFLLDHGIAE